MWQQTLSHGFDTFYPRLKVKPANPRSRQIRPYFPGYLFVHTDLGEVGTSVFQWMPNAIGLVCFGGVPARVPDEIVTGIQRRLEEVQAAGGERLHGIRGRATGSAFRTAHLPVTRPFLICAWAARTGCGYCCNC